MPVPSKSSPSLKLVKAVQMKPERLCRKGLVEQMGFKSTVKEWGVVDGESEGGDWMRWYVQDEVNQEESE